MSIKNYNFTQGSDSNTWTINHNLGTKNVAADILTYEGLPLNLTKSVPSTLTVTTNQMVITFGSPKRGRVRILGE